jgi:hypothetical protein
VLYSPEAQFLTKEATILFHELCRGTPYLRYSGVSVSYLCLSASMQDNEDVEIDGLEEGVGLFQEL